MSFEAAMLVAGVAGRFRDLHSGGFESHYHDGPGLRVKVNVSQSMIIDSGRSRVGRFGRI